MTVLFMGGGTRGDGATGGEAGTYWSLVGLTPEAMDASTSAV